MLLPGIDSTEVVSVVSEAAYIAVRAYATVSARLSPSGGNSGWGQFIGLIPDEADINTAQRSLELINVPDGHTCGPA